MKKLAFLTRKKNEWVSFEESKKNLKASEEETFQCYKCHKEYVVSAPRGTIIGIDCTCGHKWNEIIPE